MLLAEISNNFGVNNIDFLTMHRIKKNINNLLIPLIDNLNTYVPLERPYVAFYLRPILKDKKGVRGLIQALNIKEKNSVFFNRKWCRDLDSEIDIQTWKKPIYSLFQTNQR